MPTQSLAATLNIMQFPPSREFVVDQLGPCTIPSPLPQPVSCFADETRRVLACSDTEQARPYLETGEALPSFEAAGPRGKIFFDPERTSCAIVTCGGLCPGVNNVIRSIVLMLVHQYGVRRILGFRYGYAGLSAKSQHEPILLTPGMVSPIHERGGTLLGTSRGPVPVEEMAETLIKRNIDILFAVGGDGTLRGAQSLSEEIKRRGLPISIIGIPKTIDNDLNWTERSFGFRTAVEAACYNIMTAHTEAVCHLKGIGLVKLMGRHSGFIAAHSTLANADVNLCLVPEIPFELEGKQGLLATLEHRLDLKDHAVIVVAEGAGQEHMIDAGTHAHDPSGNVVLKDIGIFLKNQIEEHFLRIGKHVTIKYIDPSYSIRSQPANSLDSELCLTLGQHAVHAGMAGRTNMVLGYWNGNYTHMPIAMAAGRRKQLDPKGRVWQRVLESTGQPSAMISPSPVSTA